MAETRTYGNMTVNDGHGLLDYEGLIDTIVLDCNDSVKKIMEGNYIGFCGKMVEMVQKLNRLKAGVKNDMDSKDNRIREMEKIINKEEYE